MQASETTEITVGGNDTANTEAGGLMFAKNLNFTEAQYYEAIKRDPSSRFTNNRLLAALINVDTEEANRGRLVEDQDREVVVQTNDLMFDPQVSSSSASSTLSTSSCSTSLVNSCLSASSSNRSSMDNLNNNNKLRKIYVDGSNVARTHGRGGVFSWPGIKFCVDWFMARQHKVRVLVPAERCQPQSSDDRAIFNYLWDNDVLIETPTGCNDDLFIIDAARQYNGVIVSNDLFRDEKRLNDEMQNFIYLNRLPYIFDEDCFLPANDPRGRSGPSLDQFLRESSENGFNNMRSTFYLSKSHQHKLYQRSGPKVSTNNRDCGAYYNARRSLQSIKSKPVGRDSVVFNNGSTAPVDSLGRQQSNMLHTEHINGNHQQHQNYQQQYRASARRTISTVSEVHRCSFRDSDPVCQENSIDLKDHIEL